MVGLLSNVVKLVNQFTKSDDLNKAVKDSNGVVDLLGRLIQLGINGLDKTASK